MLGKLFSGFPTNGTTNSCPVNPLDSNLEDHFTYNLLFPDAEALCHNDQVFSLSSATVLPPASINAFDVNGEIDLEMRDVRIIIMQEATPTSGSAYLLYDSHSPPLTSPNSSLDRQASNNAFPYSTREGRRSISSSRKTSVGQSSRPVIIQQEREQPRPFGAFDRRPMQQNKGLSYIETEGQRSAREYREEVTTFSNCIFGNSEVLAYKGTGTKVHILPSESRSTFTTSSYAGEGSFGRSSMRSSKLAQSFTSDSVSHAPILAGFTNTSPTSRGSDRKKVLITRMFPVPLPNENTDDGQKSAPTNENSPSTDLAGYPFPSLGERTEKKPQPKQKRTPMYAVGMVVHLPSSPQASSGPMSRSNFRPGSYTDQESCPSSFNSTRRAGWTVLGHGFGVESMESSFSSDVDDRTDIITQHWDVVMRTLSHVQAVATACLLPLLKQTDLNSPEPRVSSHHRAPSASISISGKRVEEIKPFKVKTNLKTVQLTANCLMQVQQINKEVEASRQRIVNGIKSFPVITGQDRWGIWREEARLVGKWGGGKDEGFFFFNLLTGFLGNHTEWLRSLGPMWYRRRHYQKQKSNKDDDISLPARTIIVSDNKLMARRLIFLLSAFLPPNQYHLQRHHHSSTTTSFGAYSNSPPAVPILREESLRRRINKRSATIRTPHSRTLSFPAQGMHGNALEIYQDRRGSDATSIKTANLPIPGSDLGTRKSSAATTSTVTPVTTMPHFSRRPVRGTGPVPRPGSSGSLAADDLIRSLKRGDSTGVCSSTSTDSQDQNSGWGSMLSGLWSSRRRDSTAATSPPSLRNLKIYDPHYRATSPHKNDLVQMVEEVSCGQMTLQKEREKRKSESGSASTARPNGEAEVESEDEGEAEHAASRENVAEQEVQVNERIPDPNGAFESPVKTSINDGIIDIDVPLPEYLHFESAVSSPSSSGHSFSTPGVGWGLGNGIEGFEHYSRIGADPETALNVGGWLPHFHPDFALQAIPKQNYLVEDIKASMRAEPTPMLTATSQQNPREAGGHWVDICSAVIADTANFTIKHLRYRRLIKPINTDHGTVPSLPQTLDSKYGNVYSAAALTPSIDRYEGHVEEQFVEEPIISMDETLIEAVERVIAQSGQCSKGSSICSSRSPSRQGRSRERSNSDVGDHAASKNEANLASNDDRKLGVPRNECKKMVLAALEEIVRSVVDSRERSAFTQEDGSSGVVEREREKESFLREGIRTWLGTVDEAD